MRTSTVVAVGLFALGLSGIVAVALRASESDPNTSSATTSAALPEPSEDRGGWVRIADEQGRLKQQYRADTLEPAPDDLGPGWIKVQGADLRLIDPRPQVEDRQRGVVDPESSESLLGFSEQSEH